MRRTLGGCRVTVSEETGKDKPDSGRFLGRFPVRLKLVAVLFLPVVLLVALAGLQVLDSQRDAQAAQAEAQLASAVTGPGSLLDLLMDERNQMGAYLFGGEEMFSESEPGLYLELREQADEAAEEFSDFVAGESAEIQEIYAPALEGMSEMEEIRASVDADDGPQDFQNIEAVVDLFQRMDEVINPFLDANEQVSLTVTDPALRNGTTLVDQTLRQKNNLVLLVHQVAIASLGDDAAGFTNPDRYVPTAMLLRDMQVGDRVIRLNAEGDLRDDARAVLDSPHWQEFSRLIAEGLDTGDADVIGVLEATQGRDESRGALDYDDLRLAAEAEIERVVDARESDARLARNLLLFLGLVVMGLVGAITVVVAMSITRPLRALMDQAMRMADQRLPEAVQEILETPPGEDVDVPEVEPIDVRTRDEIADVATALNTVQDSALRLAVEQAALRRNIADSFVNLGRRNQGLVGRQLDLITELENNETNPESLASLFRLDHLATRMRRNAESLLVLAGMEPPRRWSAPVRLTDVVRAALGEVEDYHRVTIREVEPATVAGSVAVDLAHLLAELIENALTFSPPGQPVEVRGRSTPVPIPVFAPDEPSPERSVYTLTIADAGVGMRDEDIERANMRLAGKESFTIAPSKFLGHYVAGMIAIRHNIEVRLQSSPGQGLTATVGFPPSVLSGEQPTSVSSLRPQADADRPASYARAFRTPTGDGALAMSDLAQGGRGPDTLRPTSRASLGTGTGGQPSAIDTYRVGDSEYHVDRGTLPVGPVAERSEGYARLIQRVQGAQKPVTEPVNVPRAGQPASTGTEPTHDAQWVPGSASPDRSLQRPPGNPHSSDDERRARHVRSFLSSFSTGLEQGRHAASAGDDDGQDEHQPGEDPNGDE